MSIVDTVTTPFRWLGHARDARVFHPRGVVCTGTARTIGTHPLPFISGEVTARISKGLGTPGAWPDIMGLAVRLPWGSQSDSRAPSNSAWDLLLAGPAPLGGRVPIPLPTTGWTGATVSSLTPYRHDGTLYWIRGRITEPDGLRGLDVSGLAETIRTASPVVAVIEASTGPGSAEPVLHLELDRLFDDDVDFDPILHKPASVDFAPKWLADLRRSAYRDSRTGRHD